MHNAQKLIMIPRYELENVMKYLYSKNYYFDIMRNENLLPSSPTCINTGYFNYKHGHIYTTIKGNLNRMVLETKDIIRKLAACNLVTLVVYDALSDIFSVSQHPYSEYYLLTDFDSPRITNNLLSMNMVGDNEDDIVSVKSTLRVSAIIHHRELIAQSQQILDKLDTY